MIQVNIYNLALRISKHVSWYDSWLVFHFGITGSVMHYDQYSFAKDRSIPTIYSKTGGPLGNTEGFSLVSDLDYKSSFYFGRLIFVIDGISLSERCYQNQPDVSMWFDSRDNRQDNNNHRNDHKTCHFVFLESHWLFSSYGANYDRIYLDRPNNHNESQHRYDGRDRRVNLNPFNCNGCCGWRGQVPSVSTRCQTASYGLMMDSARTVSIWWHLSARKRVGFVRLMVCCDWCIEKARNTKWLIELTLDVLFSSTLRRFESSLFDMGQQQPVYGQPCFYGRQMPEVVSNV